MKKNILLIPATVAFLLGLFLAGCSLTGIISSHETKTTRVTVTGSAANDLGQVMVFAKDKEGEKVVFVKDFYSRLSSPAAQRRDMARYRRKIRRYHNRKVRVIWHENRAGNRVIEKCEVISR